MKIFKIILLLCIVSFFGCKNENQNNSTTLEYTNEVTQDSKLEIIPITHATMVLNYKDQTIYVDPTGGQEAFRDQKKASLVLITDIHGDHFNIETLKNINLNGSLIVSPQAVIDKFPEDFKPKFKALKNGEITKFKGIEIEAVPMYNLPEDETSRHPKGRGNGYILTLGDERIYISGDTEDIPEMRNLKAIDKAFVCMNLPYTMTVDSAASAVLDFKPKQVYPFHYRGKGGFSDVNKFKTIVNENNSDIEVILLDWYPEK